MARTVTESADCDRFVAEDREESLMVRLNDALFGCSRGEKLTRSIVTKSVNAVDALVQPFDYDVVNRLRQELERPFSTVRLPFLAASPRVSGVAATSIR